VASSFPVAAASPAVKMQEFDDIPDIASRATQGAGEPREFRAAAWRGSPPPTRRELGKQRRLAIAFSVTWLTVQFLAFGIRGDLAQLPVGYLLGLIAAPFSAGIVAVVAACHGGRFGLGVRPLLVFVLALVCPLLFLVAGMFMPEPYPGGEMGNLEFGAYCLDSTVVWALLPIVSAGIVLRGAFASGAVWRSALLGGGCGLVAAALFTLHCPVVGKMHIVFAHGGAVILSALVGALLLSHFTRA
jgi:hypothetical protein